MKFSYEYGVRLPIFFGILGFVFSICFLTFNLNPKDGDLELILSDQTRFQDKNAEDPDTLFISNVDSYVGYLDSIKTDDKIFIPQKNNLASRYEWTKPIDQPKLFLKQSKILLKGELFSSNDSSYLDSVVDNLDEKFERGGSNFDKKYLLEIELDNSVSLHSETIQASDYEILKPKDESSIYLMSSRILSDITFASTEKTHLLNTINYLDEKYSEGFDKFSDKQKFFLNRNPKILLWFLLISMVIGFSFALVPIFIAEIKSLNAKIEDSKGLILFLNVLFSIFVIFCLFIPGFVVNLSDFNFSLRPRDMTSLFDSGMEPLGLLFNSIVPYVGPLFWLILILTLNTRANMLKLKVDSTAKKPNSDEKPDQIIESLRKDFDRYFVIIGIFLAFSIIATNVQITGLNSLLNQDEKILMFPVEFSLVNGFMQTFFLVLIYSVVNANLNFTCRKVGENENLPKARMNQLIENKDFKDYVKIILALLAPLIGTSLKTLIDGLL